MVLITGLPESSWSESDIIKLIQPFGTPLDIISATQIGKVGIYTVSQSYWQWKMSWSYLSGQLMSEDNHCQWEDLQGAIRKVRDCAYNKPGCPPLSQSNRSAWVSFWERGTVRRAPNPVSEVVGRCLRNGGVELAVESLTLWRRIHSAQPHVLKKKMSMMRPVGSPPLQRLLFGLQVKAVDPPIITGDNPGHKAWVFPGLTDFHHSASAPCWNRKCAAARGHKNACNTGPGADCVI